MIWLQPNALEQAKQDEQKIWQEVNKNPYPNSTLKKRLEHQSQQGIRIYHYHTDHLGTPQELTNDRGDVVWLNYSQAWGGSYETKCFAKELDNLDVSADLLQPIRFQGQFFDGETNLHYNRFRYYDSDVGMFVSRDPIGLNGGYNIFQYVMNPTEWVDPTGLLNYRDKFWNRVGQTNRSKYQVHHIIPQAVFSGGSNARYKSASTILKCNGMDQDSFVNLIGLPKDVNDNPRGNSPWFGSSQHNSSHDGYSGAVADAIVRIGRIKSCSLQKARLLNLQQSLRRGLDSGQILMPKLGATKVDWDFYLRGFQ